MSEMYCQKCDLFEEDNGEFILHAFSHIIEYNRKILHQYNTKEGYIEDFIHACKKANLTDSLIEKLRQRAEYLIDVNLRK